jgi:8-oxo-dGTP diphosphatase
MKNTNHEIAHQYGNKIRIRVCGIIIQNGKILLVKHEGLGPDGILWSPPGGGLEFGETIENALKREIKEEVGIDVIKSSFYQLTEFIQSPFHAIELFHHIHTFEGNLQLGSDPELQGHQALCDARWFNKQELQALPSQQIHLILQNNNGINELLKL